jgi:3-hydroxyisobutyrate dehydrogenase
MSPFDATIALAGLGRMGLPACARLTGAGFEVIATDLRPQLRPDVVALGARWAPSAAAAAGQADILLTMLPGPGEVAAVAEPVLGSLAPGTCWVEMSTGSPALAARLHAAAAAAGVSVVDAPMGGGPGDVRAGRLVVFGGGEAADLERCRPVLDTLADRVVHVGPAGSGYAVKLFVNGLWFAQAAASAEILTLGRRLGLDLEVLHGALNQSAVAGSFVAEPLGALLDGDDLRTFSLRRCCEELDSVLDLGAELDVELELMPTVARVHQSALEHYGDVDGELLGARWVAERAGVTLDRAPRPSAGPDRCAQPSVSPQRLNHE